MSQPNDVARCVGKTIPFGHAYTSECKTCARSTASAQVTKWLGPVAFTETCPFKIERDE